MIFVRHFKNTTTKLSVQSKFRIRERKKADDAYCSVKISKSLTRSPTRMPFLLACTVTIKMKLN